MPDRARGRPPRRSQPRNRPTLDPRRQAAGSQGGDPAVIEEADLETFRADPGRPSLPPEWQTTFWGGPMPDFLSILRRQRSEH